MTARPIPESQWPPLSEFVARRMGLHFPRERRDDLQRGLAGAAREFGLADAAACADWLLAAPPSESQLQVLATHLTIGETYFFRDPQVLQALAGPILPELIRSRRGRQQRLRIWSAGCCSGEEPYSLAILVHEALPDLRDWQVTITATDINPRFLNKAAAGVYGEWSFRDAPAGLKERYFERTADGRYAIARRIKRMVSFSHLNLAQDAYPSLAGGTNAMDIIFCRNVLMYFTPPQARTAIGKLHHALVEGGWLVASPSEASQAMFPEFATVNFPGAILYRKCAASAVGEPNWMLPPVEKPGYDAPPEYPAQPALPPAQPSRPSIATAERLYQAGRYAEAVDQLAPFIAGTGSLPRAFSLLARSLANLGRLDEGLAWCERWVGADKLDPAGHYLRAIVLLERGEPESARLSLQRALYIEPDFVLAHFALGGLARSRGNAVEAGRHFANALLLLGRHPPDESLPESDGLTARRLIETITSMSTEETSP
ncbi:MAG: tetratricopeptide repeat protein [Burkholderiales bacterium]|nr:tetratricopeptide repeat protein [Burkholderiales bacterium]